MKKVLSLVLVIAMVLSSMSFAFAAKFEDVADTDYAEAIETLTALGVVTGYEDGTYRPEKTITRAEMAKLMVITLGYGDLVAGSKSNFTDTQGHWADPYIALAAGKGMVVGTGNGKFDPDRTVSYDEVYTMLVRGLGYTDTCNELKNMTWPTNFKVKAAELGITDDVDMATTGADRGGVAQAIYNALEATLVTVNTDGDVVKAYTTKENKVVYTELLSRIADLDTDYDVTPEKLDVDNKDYAGNLVDLAPYMFQNLDVYTNDDDEVVFIKDTNSLVFEGTTDDYDATKFELSIELTSGSVKDFDFDSNTVKKDDVYYNGALRESDTTLQKIYDDAETVTIVANDEDGDNDGKFDLNEFEGFVVTERSKVVRIEKPYVDGKDSLDGIQLALDDSDDLNLSKVTVTGDATSLEDIEKDDIVVVYAAEDDSAVKLVVTRNSVEGKVTRVYDKNTFYIDGTSYDLASSSLVSNWGLELGDEGIFYLDQEGEIADYDGEAAGPTDYAVIIGSANGKIEKKFGISVDSYPELKLATQNDEEIVYELALDLNSNTGKVKSSVEVTDSKVGTISEGEIFDGKTYTTDGEAIVIDTILDTNKEYLVQYSLDSNGRIDELEVIADVTAYSNENSIANLNEVDLDSKSDTLVDGAIIFDATDKDYAVISADDLDAKFYAFEVLNKNGEIEVLVVHAGEADKATNGIYAYVTKVTATYNAKGDKVNEFVIYVDGKKQEILSTDNGTAVKTWNKVMSFEYDGTAIDEDELDTTVLGAVATATSISAGKGKIQLDFVNSSYDHDDDNSTAEVTLNDGWFALSEHATILELESDGDVSEVQDLYDIDDNDVVTVYLNADGDIDLITVLEK
jgi:S-layer family protein